MATNPLTPRVNNIETGGTWKIGDVKQSFLTEAEFQAEHDDTWVLCDGRDVIGSDYAVLKEGDAVTSHNIPDARGQFLRGKVNLDTISGDGLASDSVLDQATFNSHGINRTGFKIKLQSGTLSGLNTSTEYYAIVVDENTLAFATSLANAQSDTRVGISGTNSAVLVQYENPNGDVAVGTQAVDNIGRHRHIHQTVQHVPFQYGQPNGSQAGTFNGGSQGDPGYYAYTSFHDGDETTPKNVTVNTFIKINE